MKVPALRIEVNGQLIAVAGAEGLSLLTATVGLGSGTGAAISASQTMFGVMGISLHGARPQQLNWASGVKLQPGDTISFQVVEVEQPSQPDKVISTPSAAQLAAEAKRQGRKR